jgi:hypothetical protein
VDAPQANGQRRGSLDVVRKERWVRKERDETKTTRLLRQMGLTGEGPDRCTKVRGACSLQDGEGK